MAIEQLPADAAVRTPPYVPVKSAAEPQPQTVARTPAADFLKQRLHSLDTYRGLIMVALAFNGFGLAATAQNHLRAEGASPFWEAVFFQFSHVEWVGCGFWDLIQPSFMFMVGVAAAFSFAKRRQTGQSEAVLFGHILLRSLVLVSSSGYSWFPTGDKIMATELDAYERPVSQIGLAYHGVVPALGKIVSAPRLAVAA